MRRRDVILERAKEYYKAHKDEIREYQKTYKAHNKERLQAKNKAYYEKNKVFILERRRQKRLKVFIEKQK